MSVEKEALAGLQIDALRKAKRSEELIKVETTARGTKGLLNEVLVKFANYPDLLKEIEGIVEKRMGADCADLFFNPEARQQFLIAEQIDQEIMEEKGICCGVYGWNEEMQTRLLAAGTPWIFGLYRYLSYSNHYLDFDIRSSVRRYFSDENDETILSAMEILIDELEVKKLKAMAEKFVERKDVERPFEGKNEWNINREFPLTLNGKEYNCRLVVSPDSGWKCSFILNPLVGVQEKHSWCLALGANYKDFGREMYQSALNSTDHFYSMLEKQAAIKAGKEYGDVDLRLVMTKLELTGKFEPADFEKDPAAPYALLLDLQRFQAANSSLLAPEYAAMICDKEELNRVVVSKDKAGLMRHIIRGCMELFAKVLAEGTNGAIDLLAGADEDQLKTALAFGNKKDPGEFENRSVSSVSA